MWENLLCDVHEKQKRVRTEPVEHPHLWAGQRTKVCDKEAVENKEDGEDK